MIGPVTFAAKLKTLPGVAKNVVGVSFKPGLGNVVICTAAVGMWIANGPLTPTGGSMILVA